ncbi:hypothetical protein FE844_030015 (plasmid) [Rhizobium indicum]|uniref:hypothetical protein n=1 Tax=Rhizobium indicum TaxID=2583231 RepID=UPI00156DA741|nr:hypothetical protein [Rhizobium indicum]QKK33827.1 hypothetical protein FE844_030015 [Rhizobium indicum]
MSNLLGQEAAVFNPAARTLCRKLLSIAGQRPIVATKLPYYSDPQFAGLFAKQEG